MLKIFFQHILFLGKMCAIIDAAEKAEAAGKNRIILL